MPLYVELTRPIDWRVSGAVNQITNNLQNSPLGVEEQLNLFGYSTGSVIMAQSALLIAEEGHVIDNLILLGSQSLMIRNYSKHWSRMRISKYNSNRHRG